MKIEGEVVTFSTGTVQYATAGIIGINTELGLFSGRDGGFCDPEDGDLTPAECAELADHMISLWYAFKEYYSVDRVITPTEYNNPFGE